jgi:hypothetical protein
MIGFFISKRKFAELLILILLDVVFFVLWKNWDFLILFSMGYIWNWVASQQHDITLGNPKRYRFSTIQTVFNLQNLFLRPFPKAPVFLKIIIKCLPAGIFWSAVILFNESNMPWWGVFLGSLNLEMVLLESKLFKSKEKTL